MTSMRIRFTAGPHKGTESDLVESYKALRLEALDCFADPLPTQTADTYTRDGATFNRKGQLVAISGWPVEEIE